MVVCALIREVLGNGSIWGVEIAFLKDYRISSLAGAFGGYLVLAIVMAVINKVLGINLHHHDEEAVAEEAEATEAAPVAETVEATETVETAETVETEATEAVEETPAVEETTEKEAE
jgi:hypothetical protein